MSPTASGLFTSVPAMRDAVLPVPGESLAGRFLVPTARRLREAAARGRPCVLICEDDPLLAMELEAEVVEAGAACCGTAASSGEALALAGLARPDVALVDLNLADGPTGVGLAGELDRRGVRILVLSGDTAIHRPLGRTPHIFLPKPVSSGVLQDVLRTLLMSRSGATQGGTESLPAR